MGGTSPLLTDNHYAQRSLADRGGTPPLTDKIRKKFLTGSLTPNFHVGIWIFCIFIIPNSIWIFCIFIFPIYISNGCDAISFSGKFSARRWQISTFWICLNLNWDGYYWKKWLKKLRKANANDFLAIYQFMHNIF